MSESLTITCDRCSERVAKAFRTRIRFGPQPRKRAPLDLCADCCETLLLIPMGLETAKLPFVEEPAPPSLWEARP